MPEIHGTCFPFVSSATSTPTHEVKAAAVAPPSFKAAVAAIDAVGERVSARLDATTTALDAVRAAVADGVAAAEERLAAAEQHEQPR